MEVQNALANRIDTAGQKAAYDSYCKRLLANKQILARILKVCVPEFNNCTIEDIQEKYIEGTPQVSEIPLNPDESTEFIHGENSEDTTMTEGTITYDIRFWAVSPSDGGLIRMLINCEAQNKYNPGYPLLKRGIYYCGRMLSGQYGTEFENSEYQKLKKVVSIWVCTDPPAERRNTITGYSMDEWNLIGDVKEKKEYFDLITVLMVCLGGPSEQNYDGLLKMLDVLLSDKVEPARKKEILQDEFEISMTREMESEAINMCNLSDGIVSRTTVEHIVNMMAELNLTEEECMNVLKIPEEQKPMYHDMLKEQMVVS